MSHLLFSDTGAEFASKLIRFPNFDISWAGESGLGPKGFCFGSTDGRILFTDQDFRPIPPVYDAVQSGEAINGVAFAGDMMAITTRAELRLARIEDSEIAKCPQPSYPGGAHGVIATPSGMIVAALGTNGHFVTGRARDGLHMVVIKAEGVGPYCYEVASLGTTADGELLISAARREGFTTLEISHDWKSASLRGLRLPGADVISVCSLHSEQHPFAAAALGIDQSILLTRDVLASRPVSLLPMPNALGKAYKILSARDHLIVLTSRSLLIYPGLVSFYLDNDGLGPSLAVYDIPLKAVDAYVVDDLLLVELPDGIGRLRLDELADHGGTTSSSMNMNEHVKHVNPEFVHHEWEVRMPLDLVIG